VIEGIGKRMGGKDADGGKRRTFGISEMEAIAAGRVSWTWILETLGSCTGGGRASVFLNKEGSGGATEKMPAEKMEISITFARGQNGNLTLCLFGRHIFI